MSQSYPHPDSPLAAALFLIRAGRLHELDPSTLAGDDRARVTSVLRTELRATRLRALRAHAIGIALTMVFVAAGVAVMALGPSEVLGDLDVASEELGRQGAAGMVWVIVVTLLAGGGFAADYVLRGRLRIARSWAHHARTLREMIERVEQPRGA